MAKPIRRIGGSFKPIYLPHWEHLGTERLTMDSSDQAATIPAGAEIIEITAGAGDVWYNVNLGFADATSGVLVPQNATRIQGPLSNIASLHVYGVSPAIAYLQYYRETEQRV